MRSETCGCSMLVLTMIAFGVHFFGASAFGQHEHGATVQSGGERIVKEVVGDTVKAIAEVPPIVVGKPFTLRLGLRHASSDRPIHATSAMLHMDFVYTDEGGRRQTISQSFAMEEAEAGVYEHRDRFAVAGPLTITFHVTEIDSVTLTTPIDLSVETEVSEPSETEQRPGMHGMHGMMGYGILGGVIAAVMILAMIFGRHWR